MITSGYYCAVRRTQDSGREWLEVSTMSALRGVTEAQAAQTDRNCGVAWSKANPVVRIVAVNVVSEDTSCNG